MPYSTNRDLPDPVRKHLPAVEKKYEKRGDHNG